MRLAIPRPCSCGRVQSTIPAGFRYQKDEELSGLYWECQSCRSTMFARPENIIPESPSEVELTRPKGEQS